MKSITALNTAYCTSNVNAVKEEERDSTITSASITN
jgi:hypothetical protein